MEMDKQKAKKLTPQQEDFIEVESTCCLCGTELQFEHKQEENGIGITEKAQCPCCKIVLNEKEISNPLEVSDQPHIHSEHEQIQTRISPPIDRIRIRNIGCEIIHLSKNS